MKSSKGKGRPKHRDVPPPTLPSSRRGWVLIAVSSAVALGLVLFLLRDNPQHLLREAEALLERDPLQAGKLLERSVAAAGGDFPPAQILLCEALGRQGRWVEALGCFSLIKDKSAGEGRRFMELSAAAFSAGEPILAEQVLEAAQQISIPEAEVLKALIPVRLALGHDEQALADSRRLAVLAPDISLPHMTEARILRRRRDILAASAAYRAALARTKSLAETVAVRQELVEVLIQEGNVDEARREFDQLATTSVADDALALLRAYILRLERRSREAVEPANKYLAAHPDHSDALLLLGTLYFDLNEHERAVVALRRLTELEPFHKEAHYLLGRAYLKLGQPEKAKTHLDTSQRLSALAQEILTLEGRMAEDQKKDPQTYLRLAELYDATGQTELGARLRQAAAGLTNRHP